MQGLTERWHNDPICCFKVTSTPKRCHLWNYMAQNCESLSQVKRECLQQGTLEIRLGPPVFLSWKRKERERASEGSGLAPLLSGEDRGPQAACSRGPRCQGCREWGWAGRKVKEPQVCLLSF